MFYRSGNCFPHATYNRILIYLYFLQVFFSYRVFLLSQIRYYFAVYASLAVIRLGCSITLASQPIFDITILVSNFRWLVITGTALGAFIDFSNTIALCILLKTKQGSIKG